MKQLLISAFKNGRYVKDILDVIEENAHEVSHIDADDGSSYFHHIAAAPASKTKKWTGEDLVVVFEKLALMGCSINAKDSRGKTALHVAVENRNEQSIIGLLECGIDISILDDNNTTAFNYLMTAREKSPKYCGKAFDYFVDHVYKILAIGKSTEKQDRTAYRKVREWPYIDMRWFRLFSYEQNSLSNIKLNESTSMYNFLQEWTDKTDFKKIEEILFSPNFRKTYPETGPVIRYVYWNRLNYSRVNQSKPKCESGTQN